MKADLSTMFLLGEAFERSAVRAEIICPFDNDDINKWIVGDCSKPVMLRQAEGHKYYDFIGTTSAAIDLISSRIVAAMHQGGITGLATCPTDLKDKNGEAVIGYELLGTIGRCGPLDNGRSLKTMRPNKVRTAMIELWLGYYFDEESWDGSDIFRPNGTRMIIVTNRTKNLIEQIGATNISFKPILEVERLVL